MRVYLLPVILLVFTRPMICVSLLTIGGIDPVLTDPQDRGLNQTNVSQEPKTISPREVTDLLTMYPGMFKTWRELPDYSSSSINPALESFSITGEGEISSRTSFHGCCLSEPRLDSFNTLTDPFNVTVQLVKIGQRKQHFPTESCSQDPNCVNCGCSCTMVYQTMTALIYKPGQTKEVTFSFVRVPSFCRCMNNLKRDL